MTLRVRRVVTGHDAQRRSVVSIDETVTATPARRPGQEACVVWTTDRVPADNLDPADGSQRAAGSTLPGGATFRVVRYAAGTAGRMHGTRSQDYAIVLDGCITLALDDGAEVSLQPGDVLVQRGTVHNWVNRSAAPCTIAFVLIDALPVDVGSG